MKQSSSTTIVAFTVFITFFSAPFTVLSLRTLSTNPCDNRSSQYLRTLRSDQVTVLINGYSESRIPLLTSIAATYAASSSVSAVLVLWGNPNTPKHTLRQLRHNFSISDYGGAPISVVRQSSDSLNARFLPRSSITTRGVLICDDDVEVDLKSIDFSIKIWSLNPDRLIGLFARSHDLDLSTKTWIYTVHPDRYSIILTKFMILNHDYLYKYSCEGGSTMIKLRKIVDLTRNCEDILMNFVVADTVNAGPVLVGADRARDWGDARNDDQTGTKEREVGLSSRVGNHRKRRGECIREFHKIMGKMPLRYGYGKMVNSIGEQGLCEKQGKLVFCDQQVGV